MNKRKLIRWILPLLWMAVIFYFSHQPANESSKLSSKVAKAVEVIVNIVRIEPESPADRGIEIHNLIRSLAHFALYFILGILLYVPLLDTARRIKKAAGIAFAIGFLYAVSDEIHQLYVDGRAFQLTDIAVDSAGVLFSLVLCILITKLSKRNRELLLQARASF